MNDPIVRGIPPTTLEHRRTYRIALLAIKMLAISPAQTVRREPAAMQRHRPPEAKAGKAYFAPKFILRWLTSSRRGHVPNALICGDASLLGEIKSAVKMSINFVSIVGSDTRQRDGAMPDSGYVRVAQWISPQVYLNVVSLKTMWRICHVTSYVYHCGMRTQSSRSGSVEIRFAMLAI